MKYISKISNINRRDAHKRNSKPKHQYRPWQSERYARTSVETSEQGEQGGRS